MSSNPYNMKQKDGIFTYPPPLSPPFPLSSPYYSRNYEEESSPSSSSSFSRISPVLLWILVTLAAIFFISGLIHLLIRYLIKKRSSFSIIYHSNRFPDTSRSHSLQRQLQQLFRLHDSGLDQACIDTLPVFDYKEIMGLKEPFDCAVCLCEFSEQDKLRLLPICGHAFHIDCIGTWLLSNSTCPLCRATLLGSGLPMENPLLLLSEHSRESSDRHPSHVESGFSCSQQHAVILEEDGERRVFSVRLGKLRSLNDGQQSGAREQGETSRMNLDTRRCYSMGSFQYVVGDSNLQVALPDTIAGVGDAVEGKRIIGRTRGDSFSVSKVWLWSKRSQFTASSSSHMWVPSNLSSSLPTNDSGQFV